MDGYCRAGYIYEFDGRIPPYLKTFLEMDGMLMWKFAACVPSMPTIAPIQNTIDELHT